VTAGSTWLVTPLCFCESEATRFNATHVRTDCFVSIKASVVLAEEYNVVVELKNC